MDEKDIESAILNRIAVDDGIDRSTMNIGENDAVLFRSNGQLLAWGQKGSTCWLEMEAELKANIATARVIEQAARK